jgi:MFS family permease
MLRRLTYLKSEYPSQFWLLFWGYLISTIGASMIWPFLMIYVSEQLQMPLTTTASMMTVNAATGLIFSFIGGSLIDRAGRKWIMVISLVVNGLGYILLNNASTLAAFAVLMAISGAFNPLYRIGADAMMADLIPPKKRLDAYSLLRMGHNVGVALGPAIGGFIATRSYSIAFAIAAAGMLGYALLLSIFAKETMPQEHRVGIHERDRLGGYRQVLRDKPFMFFSGTFILTQICSAIMWVLLAIYAKQNYQVPESQYGLIPTTNAVMVVLFQLMVTRITKRYPPLFMLASGSFLYGLAVGSVALGQGFWAFLGSMIIMTVGELILIPTATTLTANLSPQDMRGRYMSIYGLTWGIASGIGPVIGGLLNDNIGPTAIWYGGLVIGMIATASFIGLGVQYSKTITSSMDVVGDPKETELPVPPAN